MALGFSVVVDLGLGILDSNGPMMPPHSEAARSRLELCAGPVSVK